MIVKLIENTTVKGTKFKKGQSIIVSRKEAEALCQEGLAVANEDFPCEQRHKEAAKKIVKKKKEKKTEPIDGEVEINNQL